MPIGSPRVSLVKSILGEKDWKNWKKIHRIRGFPLARYGCWEKTSLTLESISSTSFSKEKKKKGGSFRSKIRSKSCDASISLRKERQVSKESNELKKNSLASHRKVKWRNERKKKTMVVEKNTKEYDACFQWRGDRLFSLATMLTSINRFHSSPIPNQPWNPCTRIPFLSSGGTSAPRKPLLECVECVKAMLSVLSHGEHTGERACTGTNRAAESPASVT